MFKLVIVFRGYFVGGSFSEFALWDFFCFFFGLKLGVRWFLRK